MVCGRVRGQVSLFFKVGHAFAVMGSPLTALCASRVGPRILIFNQQGRSEAIDFLDGLHTASKRQDGTSFDRVMFCTNVTYAETGYKRGT